MPDLRRWLLSAAAVPGLLGLAACTGRDEAEDRPPPPDARRPVLKSQEQLSAERQALLDSGQVTPADTSLVLAAEPAIASAPARREPLVAPPGALQSDILMINESVLTAGEVIYILGTELEELRKSQTRAGFTEHGKRLIRRYVQQEIGSILVYEKALGQLSDQQREAMERVAAEEFERFVATRFGGSKARLELYVAENGLTVDQLKQLLKRQIVVRQYAREMFMPQVFVRRDELLEYYRENPEKFASPQMRELLLIEAPFERFLPPGVTLSSASGPQKANARLQAVRHIRAAHEALSQRPFADVARESSLAIQAETGGSWGMIGRPLQPPYDELSRRVFELESGRFTEPVETETGWYIVGCGQVQPERRVPFSEAQAQIRAELGERKFNETLADYVLSLAERATIGSLDAFVDEVLRRAEQTLAAASATDPLRQN